MLRIAQIDLVHSAEFAESPLCGEICIPQMITKQRQEKVGEITQEHVGAHAFGEPVAEGTQLDNALQTAEGFFDQVLVKIERKHLLVGQGASAEDTGVTVELFRGC